MISILVRRTPYSACIAHVEPETGGLRLVRVTPDDGPAPDTTGLIGEFFPDKKALRVALIGRLHDAVTGIDTTNLLDRVYLSKNAYESWQKIASGVDMSQWASNDEIPLEQAEIVGKQLRIWVDLPDEGVVEYFVSADEWAWMSGEMSH